jgi:hypothetical protein
MCPACVGTVALIAGSATTGGGAAAWIAVNKFKVKDFVKKFRIGANKSKETRNGN